MTAFAQWLLATDDPSVIRHRNEVLAFASKPALSPRGRPADPPVIETARSSQSTASSPATTSPSAPAEPRSTLRHSTPRHWATPEPDPAAVNAYLQGTTPAAPTPGRRYASASARSDLERLAHDMALLAERRGVRP